jgi:hypothetical protein
MSARPRSAAASSCAVMIVAIGFVLYLKFF